MPLYALYNVLKSHKSLWLSKKTSLCEIENAAGGANLHPPPDRVKMLKRVALHPVIFALHPDVLAF